MFYIYILRSEKDGSYYIGQTTSVEKRIQRHNAGLSRYTRRKKPWRVVYKEIYSTRSEAIKRERQIKSYKGGEAFRKLVSR